jgi:hypothetical protein
LISSEPLVIIEIHDANYVVKSSFKKYTCCNTNDLCFHFR